MLPDGRAVPGLTPVKGRHLRPGAAFALLPAGVPLRRGFRPSVEEAARRWNETLGRILAKDLDEPRAEPADSLVTDPGEATGAADGTR
ncbi:hypothetical protein [Streptomyces sp. NPDC059802]|uniref:hypothetical protein n=1 Tax=Streptomyces sp. NPDC059802 TaxID=3346952 RepID=UPI0036636DF5